MMIQQLKAYTQRQIVNAMGVNQNPALYEIHMALKLLMAEPESSSAEAATGAAGVAAGSERAAMSALEQRMARQEDLLVQLHASTHRLCDTQVKMWQGGLSFCSLTLDPERRLDGRHSGHISTLSSGRLADKPESASPPKPPPRFAYTAPGIDGFLYEVLHLG